MSLPHDAQISAVFRPASSVETASLTRAGVGFVAPGSVTRGEFGLFRWEMAPNAGGPDPHFHRTFSESFYVLEGRVGLFDGASWVEAGAGEFLYVPKNGIHAFSERIGGARGHAHPLRARPSARGVFQGSGRKCPSGSHHDR